MKSNSAFKFMRQCIPNNNSIIRERKSANISTARKNIKILVKWSSKSYMNQVNLSKHTTDNTIGHIMINFIHLTKQTKFIDIF